MFIYFIVNKLSHSCFFRAKQKVLLEEVKFYDDIENRLYGSLVALDSKVARSYVSVQETNTARSDRLDQMTYNHQKSIQTPSPEIIESTAESLVSSDLGTEHPPITPTKLNIRKLKEADKLVVAKQDIPDKQNIQMYVNPEEVISTPITPRQQLQLNVDEVVAMLMEEVDQENITTNRESNILFSDAFDVLPPTESSDSVNNSEQEYLFEKEPIQVPIRNIINMHESTVPSQNPFLPTFSAKELFESPLGTTASKTSTVEDDSKIIEKFDNLSMFAEEKSSYSEHSYHSQSKSEFPILQAKENKCGIYSIDRAPRDYSDDEFYADDLSQDSISDKCCESKTIEEKIREIY